MGEDVAWSAVPGGEADLGGRLEVELEAPEEGGGGVAGQSGATAGQDGRGDQGLGVEAGRWQRVDAGVAGHQRPSAHARADGRAAEPQLQ